jgi:transposase InsO family protein
MKRRAPSCAFLVRAVACFERHDMSVRQLLTDNGSRYLSKVHAIARHALGIRHLRTYRPQTNGKAERFIRTMPGGGHAARSTARATGRAGPPYSLREPAFCEVSFDGRRQR